MERLETNRKAFGHTQFKVEIEDIKRNSQEPVVRMIDDDGELVGIFSLTTLEVVEDFDLDDCDLLLFQEAMKGNQKNFIEGWNDIARLSGWKECPV